MLRSASASRRRRSKPDDRSGRAAASVAGGGTQALGGGGGDAHHPHAQQQQQVDVYALAEGLFPGFLSGYPSQELAWLQAAYEEEVGWDRADGCRWACVLAVGCDL